jgi:hypothetical protein
MTANSQHDWQPLECTPPNPRFTRCANCGVTRGTDSKGVYWYRIPGVNCGPAHRFNGIGKEPECIAVVSGPEQEPQP